MPVETLEELRLLYNLQVGNAKLMQIVLFGQPELNAKLENPNMRQLKDRIAHHFHMQPLSRNILENYLMFRMRAAGYHGPNIFSSDAIKRIADASNGLMRRVNILADKSLLAAFVEDTHNIEARHVKAAMRDSELGTSSTANRNKVLLGAAGMIVLLAGLIVWLLTDRLQTTSSPVPSPALASSQSLPAVAPIDIASPQPALTPAPAPEKAAAPIAKQTGSLFEQRMAAGKLLVEQKNAVASLQLFYSEEIRQERIEGFLQRARGLGKLSEIYLLPAQFGDKNGLRVLYGTYPSVDMAQAAITDLPARYKDAFAASIYVF
jgi:hypothetical protein